MVRGIVAGPSEPGDLATMVEEVDRGFDDWNFGMSHRTSPRALFGREEVLSIWRDEFDQTRDWNGVATMITHPQVTGRPMRYRILEDFFAHVRQYDDVWWATGREIADHYEACERAALPA